MFAEIFLHTTNPELSFDEIFQKKWIVFIFLSILFHSILYVALINFVNYIFLNKFIGNQKNISILFLLICVMIFGYIGRVFHVKSIYHAYKKDLKKTREHCDKLYISSIFIG